MDHARADRPGGRDHRGARAGPGGRARIGIRDLALIGGSLRADGSVMDVPVIDLDQNAVG